MADRSVPLTAIQGGINRLRTKGAAPSDSLYDLLNGYVTQQKTVKVRPGTFRTAVLPTDTAGDNITHGLCSFDGGLHVFATEVVDVPVGYTLHVIVHPAATADVPIPIKKIHFAAPFLGYLYVTVEFEPFGTELEGDVFDFWLQTGNAWTADTTYKHGDIVTPSVPNGLAYQATRLGPPSLSWAPNVQRAVGDIVEPTVYNDFFYTVVDTQGTNPRSGATEPIWPTSDGEQVIEDADADAPEGSVPTTPPDLTQTPNPAVADRYGNRI